MTASPFFSIVLSTYGRGPHIRPTIESVMTQSFSDFELIVVGDGCTDETESVVASFRSERIIWINLSHNSGSQSAPNNRGIQAARGRWIAYLGHDDIWAPDHLSSMASKIDSGASLDFVVGGCIFYGPKGSESFYVTGMFESADAPFHHFFPPSSIAHRRDVTERIGGWPDPHTVQATIDNDFLLRAAHGGLVFAPTSQITVHKFAAGHRYLSYLRVESGEQWETLLALATPAGIDTEILVETSKKNGQFMIMRYVDFSIFQPGQLFEANKSNKGISRPELQPLNAAVTLSQTGEPRALDWGELEAGGKNFRWSGPNPKPRILLPYSGARARVGIEVSAVQPRLELANVGLSVEGQETATQLEIRDDGTSWLVADIPLRASDYTVLTLDAPTYRPSDEGSSPDGRRLGLAVADIVLEPT